MKPEIGPPGGCAGGLRRTKCLGIVATFHATRFLVPGRHREQTNMPQASPTLHPSEHPIDTGARGTSEPTPRAAAATGSGQTRPSEAARPADAARSHGDASIIWSDIELQVFDDLNRVEQDWQAFEHSADFTVFQSFDWLAKWQQHIGARNGTVPAVVLGRDADGHLLFIFQLAIEAARLGPPSHLAGIGAVRLQRAAPRRGFLAAARSRSIRRAVAQDHRTCCACSRGSSST